MRDYPLDLSFKIVTIGTRVGVVDASGRQVAYVRKKKFKLREDVTVYRDEGQREALFRLKADRVLDFGASYAVTAPDGRPLGHVRRRGVRSLWKSAYSVTNAGGKEIGGIREENPWVKVADGLLESVPFGDALGGLFFNPAYRVELGGETVLRLKKERSLLESRFRLEKLGDFSETEEDLLLASVVMMLLLERDRG
ncbi:hypothetical protein GBA65_16040 [Rubrobacter marinus]|uniref:Scramblase n=1 Tax=Rubrobacter marinus TaxID=2653852 RepID=A0A6G8Q035_9ACTN|nr:hypothetical protein [Rubrobacter marinus]QIN79790.1 hypothetical protein GBA65_16040 [Rubrobacter marinus]